MQREHLDMASKMDRLTLPVALSASAVLLLSGFGFVLAIEGLSGNGEDRTTAAETPPAQIAETTIAETTIADPVIEELRNETKILVHRLDALAERVAKLSAQNRLLTARFKSLETDFGTVTGSIDLMLEQELATGSVPRPETRAKRDGPADLQKSTHLKAGDENGPGRRGDRIDQEPVTSPRAPVESAENQTGPQELGDAGVSDEPAQDRIALAVPPDARIDFNPPTRTRFALKLATYSKLSGLRQVWRGLQIEHPDILGPLEPRTVLKEANSERVRIDLLAGPLDNAAEAAEICARLTEAGSTCEPDIFRGAQLVVE